MKHKTRRFVNGKFLLRTEMTINTRLRHLKWIRMVLN